MELVQSVLINMGYLVYTLPASLVVLLFREVGRIQIQARYSIQYSHQLSKEKPILSVDPMAVLVLSLTSMSWGGLLIKRKHEINWMSYISSQLATLILMCVVLIYLFLKQPHKTSYLFLICHAVVLQSWLVFILNCIPIPPFDIAYFYIDTEILPFVSMGSKAILLALFMFGVMDITWFIPNILFDW